MQQKFWIIINNQSMLRHLLAKVVLSFLDHDNVVAAGDSLNISTDSSDEGGDRTSSSSVSNTRNIPVSDFDNKKNCCLLM